MCNRNDLVSRSIRISNPKTESENQSCGSIELDLETKVDDPDSVKQVEPEYMACQLCIWPAVRYSSINLNVCFINSTSSCFLNV